jgi:hypothetical protein
VPESGLNPDQPEVPVPVQPWVAFIGFGGREMLANPDDGLIHYRGVGRLLRPRTLCRRRGRRPLRGSGRLCRECLALGGDPRRDRWA